MTENREQSPLFGDDTSHQTGAMKRRTILAGAAWSIPVIGVAVAAPAMAASPAELKLAFNQPSYSGPGCGTITGASVIATRDGQPASGETVVVTLSNGYTFGGESSFTGTSGDDGTVALPPISIPARGGPATASVISGTAPASTASAELTGVPQTTAHVYQADRNVTLDRTSIPSGVTVVGFDTFLTPDGTLYFPGQNCRPERDVGRRRL